MDERQRTLLGQRANSVGRRRVVGAAVLAVVAAALFIGPLHAGHADSPVLTVYSGQHPATTQLLVQAFEARTGINVQVRSADEAALANQLLTEGAQSPADVFYGENPPSQQLLSEHGMLAPVARATLAVVPARYSSPRADWIGVSARASAFVYNSSKLGAQRMPRSVLDLATPTWKGKLGLAPSETDFQPVVMAVRALVGQDAALRWLQGLKANAAIYDSNEALTAAVNRGDVAAGIIDHYYWYRLADQVGARGLHTKLYYFGHHDAGTLVSISGASVLASSHHAAAAQAFVAFLVSRQGQEIIAHSYSYEYPLSHGVQTAKGLRPFAQLQQDAARLSLKDLGDGRAAISMLQNVGLL